MLNFHKKIFRSFSNSANGEVGEETLFYYSQTGNVVWAEYAGGVIVKGFLIAKMLDNNVLDMRYEHINQAGELMTGKCHSTPEVLPDGRIRLYEKWQWTSGDLSSGESIVEEIISKTS
ncbi:n-acetylglutamate synthase [Emticicia sp. BO119]|uniref:n-acetylglutamate synthase n=1 Tax=Emticicia sp. BO119 TaxID=2757768 RepID=UPI0015F06F9F|nr:n-acetylglutamate synthase [Emticicia sp. BO119]MBA4854083.1 n-acetylglutamate synthase [Emticicia sp. BO119]